MQSVGLSWTWDNRSYTVALTSLRFPWSSSCGVSGTRLSLFLCFSYTYLLVSTFVVVLPIENITVWAKPKMLCQCSRTPAMSPSSTRSGWPPWTRATRLLGQNPTNSLCLEKLIWLGIWYWRLKFRREVRSVDSGVSVVKIRRGSVVVLNE